MNEKINRIVIIEFKFNLGAKSKVRGKEYLTEIKNELNNLLQTTDNTLKIIPLVFGVKEDVIDKSIGKVIFDSDANYKSEDLDIVLKKINKLDTTFLNNNNE